MKFEARSSKSEGKKKPEVRSPKFEREGKSEVRSSKSEIRREKEVRRSKVEGKTEGIHVYPPTVGEQLPETNPLVLHDGNGAPDLLERTAQFGEAVVRFAKRVPRGPVTDRLVGQLIGAACSIGANYCEAQDGVSRKDFLNRIGTSRKESKETMFFLRLIAAADETLAPEARELWREAKELNLIFGSIWRQK